MDRHEIVNELPSVIVYWFAFHPLTAVFPG